jgi:hypothetical protein
VPGVVAVQAAGPAPEWALDPASGRLIVRLTVTGRQQMTVRM